MCGISGIITRKKLTGELRSAVSRVNSAQKHRGPDGNGEFSSDHILLAMSRLAIIDPKGGWQPLYNEDKSLVLVINGEIYNYIELRTRLKAFGHQFQTDVDGEVILHLYEENEAEFIEHLRGMFAFALWDVKKRRLILARDRMGEKPLYLFERDGFLLFASELKGLLHSGLIPFELDPRAVDLYFHYQYVPEPLTPIKGVRKLDAAKMLLIDVDSWEIEEKVYWRMEDAAPLDGNPGKLIGERIEEISRLIVRSEVPIGVALSGGLDSSIVAAYASRQTDSLCAFSVGYAGRPQCDERELAAELARYLKLQFYETELNTRQIVEFFPELNYWRDDPISDIAGFGYYAVMKLARENGVSVLLQGQGGDELFWGYAQLREAARENHLKSELMRQPGLQKILQAAKFNFPDLKSIESISSWIRDLGGIRSGWQNVQKRLENLNRMNSYDMSIDFIAAKDYAHKFYSLKFLKQVGNDKDQDSVFSGDRKSMEIILTKLVCDTYLRENGITQGDRLGMSSSVEMRLPLIDYKLVETVIGLRKNQSDSQLAPKYWLKEAVREMLPDRILNRPKRGFEPPVREWHDALFAAYGDSLRNGYLVQHDILSAQGAAQLAQGEFPANATCPLSFKALVLEQWCRQMIDCKNF